MKRSLALVLALVMVLGMMAIPASADFTDAKDVKYTEAVDVVAACGIINGFEDGSFDPDGTLTREQAAKIVAYMRLGAKNADALKASSAPFEDVAANRWSAGYIAYCVNEGIINGRSDKIFDPTGTVTGFEFAKLMLGALGYDSSIEEYTGASWAINVGKTALDIDLFDGNDGADYNKPATREEAALYILNTLQADLVEYDEKGSTIDLGNGITINTGASDAKVVTTSNKNGKNIKDDAGTDGKYTYQFAEKYFEDLEKVNTTDSDAFYRPATTWNYDNEEVGTYADTADYTYTAKVKGEDIYKALGKPDADKTLYRYFLNGESVDADELPGDKTNNVSDFDGISADEKDKVGGNGVLIEIFKRDLDDVKDSDGKVDGQSGIKNVYDVVVIETYVGTIASWKAAKGANDEYVTVSAVDGAKAPNLASSKFETEQFSEDDADDETVVLYTYSEKENEIQSVVAADVATGIVTATKGSDGFTMGGTSYKYSANKSGLVSYNSDEDKEIEVYIDAYGYVIHSDDVDSADEDLALIVDISKGGDWATKTYSAKVVFAGSDTVEIVKLKNEDAYKALAAEMGANASNDWTADKMVVASYTKSSGKYVFDDIAAVAADSKLDITTKKAAMTIGGKTVYGDNDTKFLFVKTDDEVDDYKYTAYEGIKNVPDAESKTSGTATAVITKGDVTFVVVVDGKATGTSNVDDILFVHGASISKKIEDGSHDDPYYTVKAYNVTSDEAITLEITEDVASTLSKGNDLFVSGYTTDDGLVDDWDELDSDYTAHTGTGHLKYENGNLKVGANLEDQYGIADDAHAYDVDDSDKTVDAVSISGIRKTTDTVKYTVITDDDDLVVAVYYWDVD